MAKTNGSFTRQVAYTEDVTPADDTDLPRGPTRSLLVGASGKVSVMYLNGTIDDPYLLAGVFHPMVVKRVRATGTDATDIKAAY